MNLRHFMSLLHPFVSLLCHFMSLSHLQLDCGFLQSFLFYFPGYFSTHNGTQTSAQASDRRQDPGRSTHTSPTFPCTAMQLLSCVSFQSPSSSRRSITSGKLYRVTPTSRKSCLEIAPLPRTSKSASFTTSLWSHCTRLSSNLTPQLRPKLELRLECT